MKASELAPFRDDHVAGPVKRDAMRGVADALGPLRRFQTVVGALRFVGVITDLGDDAVVLAKDRDAALQFGDSHVIARNH